MKYKFYGIRCLKLNDIEDIVKTSYVYKKVATTENSNVGLDTQLSVTNPRQSVGGFFPETVDEIKGIVYVKDILISTKNKSK